ncbi:MAG: hypothetical protein ABI432_15310 [Flavobacteriales bacterium]
MAPTEGRRSSGNTDGTPTDPVDFVREMAESAADYARAERDHFKLVASQRVGEFSGRIVLFLVMILMVSGTLLMLSVAWGIWLGQCLGDPALGFVLAGATYLVLMLLFYLLWRTILRDRITLAIINTTHGEG